MHLLAMLLLVADIVIYVRIVINKDDFMIYCRCVKNRASIHLSLPISVSMYYVHIIIK